MENQKVRIQKWFSQLGIASRREAEKIIEQKRVVLNGQIASIGDKVDVEKDDVKLDGQSISRKAPRKTYLLLNKPDRTLVAKKTQQEDNMRTVFELPRLVRRHSSLNSVGRLDFRTEGLLILSNDGEFIHRLTHPKFEIPRTYHALVSRKFSKEELQKINKGVTLEDGPVKPKVSYLQRQKLGASHGYWYRVVVAEGRNRLVRRLFEHLQTKTVRLVRVAYGDVLLENTLKPGEVRELSQRELEGLKRQVNLV